MPTTVNILGQGILPPDEEAEYLAEGVRFACIIGTDNEQFVVTSRCETLAEAGAHFLASLARGTSGLPERYRIPIA